VTNVGAPWVAGPPGSEILFSVRHFVLGEIRGRAGRWSGTFALDTRRSSRSRVEVVVDATSLETGDAERDDHFRSAEFLDVRSFPEIRFRSRDVHSGADGRIYTLTGDLTIRDVTRRLTFAVSEQDEDAAERPAATRVFVGHAVVDRQEFGLHWNQDLDRGGLIVGDKVDVAIRVVLPNTATSHFLPGQQTRAHAMIADRTASIAGGGSAQPPLGRLTIEPGDLRRRLPLWRQG
jgi:polyisoprenoid-binding protein YceI